jgi:predicted regulator of amino acid metabolism with ACT domain
MSFSLCGSSGLSNTGGIECDVSRGVLDRILVYNGAVPTASYSDSDTFLSYLVTASKKSRTDSGKIFPFPSAQEIADKSEANTEGSLGLGFKTILREGLPSYEFKVFAGMVQLKALRKMNNKTIRIFEYDRNKNIWGTSVGTSFKGFQAKIFVTGGKIATGTNVEEGIVTITVSILDASEYLDNAYFMPIDGNISDISGLMDIDLVELAAHTSNAYKVGARVKSSQMGGFINMYDNFSDLLALATNWKATVKSTGADLAITTVAKDAALKGWTVTFDSTAFAALPANSQIIVEFVAPETLDAADVVGVESVPLTVVK